MNNLVKPLAVTSIDENGILRTQSTELTERSFLSSLDENQQTPQPLSKVVHNLSLMILYCLSQSYEPNELSDFFNDHEDVPQWNLSTIEHFIWNALEDGQVEYSCFLYGIIYYNRVLKSREKPLHLTQGNWRNILSTCLLLASKMFDDLGMSNEDFRNIFPTTELSRVNSFELKLCHQLDFALYVHDKDYHVYRRRYETPNSSRRQSFRAALVYVPPTACHERDDETSVGEASATAVVVASALSASASATPLSATPVPTATSQESEDLIQHLSFEPLPPSKKSRSFLGSLQHGFQAFIPYVARKGRSSPDIKRIYCA
jgi:hypothetical protein